MQIESRKYNSKGDEGELQHVHNWSFLNAFASLLLRVRNRHFLIWDALALCCTPVLALALRVDDPLASLNLYAWPLALYTATSLAIRLPLFYRFEFYRRYWRYASIEELSQLLMGGAAALAAILVLFFLARWPALGICPALSAVCALPRSLPFIDAIVAIWPVAGSRLSVRLASVWLRQNRFRGQVMYVLVAGAGDAGVMIVREMRANPQLGLEPIGYVDDDVQKHRMRIHGLPVLGDRYAIPEIVREYRVKRVVIAMPTAPGKEIRQIVRICEEADVETKILPGLYELLGGMVSVNQLRNVDIVDLLRREPVEIDTATVAELIRGKRVLVSGSGGSIGSELCRQIRRFEPAALILMGHGENSVFEIDNELRVHAAAQVKSNGTYDRAVPLQQRAIIADIRFTERVRKVFELHRPQIVFHAAAHKHVPLMENNPSEAVTNNILGTRSLVEAALATGVERFVMISTDKAVNPTSIMGASKRAAELIVHEAAMRSGRPFVAVRFGNVLGSRGSVIHTFKKQIAAGGPVTVTHPEMKRYFMTIPEAVQLVLQAAVMGEGSEVFVLDMGEPVKIVDLARDLIELSGLRVGDDIDIVFSGMREGEKLFEELFVAGEIYDRTRHEKIFIAANDDESVPANLDSLVDSLATAAAKDDQEEILRGLRSLIPEFHPVGTSVVGKGHRAEPFSLDADPPATVDVSIGRS